MALGLQKLSRAETDGSNLKIILESVLDGSLSRFFPLYKTLNSPKALELNRRSRTVYLGDGGLSEIYEMNYDGVNDSKVVSKVFVDDENRSFA